VLECVLLYTHSLEVEVSATARAPQFRREFLEQTVCTCKQGDILGDETKVLSVIFWRQTGEFSSY